MIFKRCASCGIEKPVTEFSKRAASSDGLQYICKECNIFNAAHSCEGYGIENTDYISPEGLIENYRKTYVDYKYREDRIPPYDLDWVEDFAEIEYSPTWFDKTISIIESEIIYSGLQESLVKAAARLSQFDDQEEA